MHTDSGTVFATYIDYPDSLTKEKIYAKIKTGQEEYEAKTSRTTSIRAAVSLRTLSPSRERWIHHGE